MLRDDELQSPLTTPPQIPLKRLSLCLGSSKTEERISGKESVYSFLRRQTLHVSWRTSLEPFECGCSASFNYSLDCFGIGLGPRRSVGPFAFDCKGVTDCLIQLSVQYISPRLVLAEGCLNISPGLFRTRTIVS